MFFKIYFLSFSYANCSLGKYMDKHSIRSETRAFQLLTRLLTIDPIKRLTGINSIHVFLENRCQLFFFAALDAMNDLYFKEEPRPTDEWVSIEQYLGGNRWVILCIQCFWQYSDSLSKTWFYKRRWFIGCCRCTRVKNWINNSG